MRALTALLATFALATIAFAEQYKSEIVTPGAQSSPAGGSAEEQLKAVENNPYGKAIVLQQLANEAAQKKDYKTAVRQLEQAIGQNALSEEATSQMRYMLSQLQMASGDYQKAIAGLESYIKNAEGAGRKPGADTYISLGAAYAGQKKYAQALPYIQKAIASTQSPPADWLQLLLAVQCGSGQGGDCAKAIEQRVRQNPNDKNGWLQLAAMNVRGGNMTRALAAMEYPYRQGMLTQPIELQQLAKLYIAAGSPYQAGSLLDQWMRGGKLEKSAANWELQAAAWQRAGESQNAAAALEQAAALSGRGDLYLAIGQLQLDWENWPAAISALTKAISRGGLRGGSGQAYLALGYAYSRAGDREKSAQAFAAAAKAGGDSKTQADRWLVYLDPDSTLRGNPLQIAQAGPAAAGSAPVSTDVSLDSLVAPSPAPTVNLNPGANLSRAPSDLPAGASAQSIAAGGDLTPIGAVRAGNADGVIPAWDGGILPNRWPAGFQLGRKLVDPYPNERPSFVITGANADQYRGKLTTAHYTLLKKYPDYKLPVYPTHRSVSFPQAIYDATQANSGRARLEGSDKLVDARLGFPFARPQSGVEIMWNHRVRYRGDTVEAHNIQVVVDPSGKFNDMLWLTEQVLFRYGNIKDPVDISKQNILLYYLGRYQNRGSQGFTVLAHETADSITDPRAIWVIPPGVRKMFRIPPVGYDQPFIGSGGMYFVDMIDMYNGAFDRYVWKLLGRREYIIPYNAYRISDGSYKYEQLLTPRHFNQDATRYELHRVWVIEAEERGGKRHSFGKRTFYVDEDSWTIVMVDNFDRQGNPWRFQEGHLVPRYDSQSPFCYPVVTYDLKDGRYFASGMNAQEVPAKFDAKLNSRDFLPAIVQGRYMH